MDISEGYDVSLLHSIIETAPDAIVTISAKGTILSFSPAAERMFGYRAPEIIGRNIGTLMPEPYRKAHEGQIARYLRTGESRVIGVGREVRALRKNGEEFAAELAVGELTSGDKSIFTGFVRDVSDRVEAQRRAARLQRVLDQMSRAQMLGEMSSALAHELNQPLAAVSNYARAASRVLTGEMPDQAKAASLLDRIAGEAQRAGEIIKRMRRLIERGKVAMSSHDLGGIICEAVRSHTAPMDPSQSVTLDVPENLPPVLADRIQVQQVVLNLIRNAQEAMAAPGDDGDEATLGHVSISVAQRCPDMLTVTVRDEGPGVSPDLADRLFEPFVTGKDSGIGVGLAVCRSIVHGHGGQIWAENLADGGAAFHFTLPVAGGGG